MANSFAEFEARCLGQMAFALIYFTKIISIYICAYISIDGMYTCRNVYI